MMFYVDVQRELTRRDSSLITIKPLSEERDNDKISGPTQSSVKLLSDSNTSMVTRGKGSVRKELITMMYESMLDLIVESWEVIPPVKQDEVVIDMATIKKKKSSRFCTVKPPKIKKSRNSQSDTPDQYAEPVSPIYLSWWSSPDEKAIIHFKNGNMYEGCISMKCMNGEGRFQWHDGTVYLGQFKDNEIKGRGRITWKDDTWYEGDFVGNYRHGEGLYVDSRNQRFYSGGWHRGSKHGSGIIDYSSFETNNYYGDWISNIRHGFGSREYSVDSGYRGNWEFNIREGRGLMIWPNSDIYKGTWKNGSMSGYGSYIWRARCNNTMSLPCVSMYRGFWRRNQRNGYGILELGLGAYYEGEFKNNAKHGTGIIVTSGGIVQQNKKLFIDDYLAPVLYESNQDDEQLLKPQCLDITSDTLDLTCYVQDLIDNEKVKSSNKVLYKYIESNKSLETNINDNRDQNNVEVSTVSVGDNCNLEDKLKKEESGLRKVLEYYETRLNTIYYQYAIICNTEHIHFTPILIRLYLWQFFIDCNVREKGLTLVEIDRMLFENHRCLLQKPHDPFEPIRLWQFWHSLITVAIRLYGKIEPLTKPKRILATAFRTFIKCDVLPGIARRYKGHLLDGYGSIVPLTGAYELYRTIGEPHSVREFICAVRKPPLYDDHQRRIVDASDDYTPIGWNRYAVFGDEMAFILDHEMGPPQTDDERNDKVEPQQKLNLFNLGNLSSLSIIKIFSRIYPQFYSEGKILNVGTEMTFYEFFEAFVSCAEESVRSKKLEDQRLKEIRTINPLNQSRTKSKTKKLKPTSENVSSAQSRSNATYETQ